MSVVYLTFLEQMSGVYSSQVIDVCRFLETNFNIPVKLIAILSPRNFLSSKEQILQEKADATIIRSVLGWRAWPVGRRIVLKQIARALPIGTKSILARGPVAGHLALELRRRGLVDYVGFDGRGAQAAEWTEYCVAPNDTWRSRIGGLEHKTVNEVDFRIAVSNALINYWIEAYSYQGSDYVVIPCTLNQNQDFSIPKAGEIAARRFNLGFAPDQIIICYAGSNAEWQSIARLDSWLEQLMGKDPRIALLMMTRADLSNSAIVRKYGERVKQIWAKPEEVASHMQACDYGLLLRESSITNSVSAPTKFAEYLAAGLKILISPNIGDYSGLVQSTGIGDICRLEDEPPSLELQSYAGRNRQVSFAMDHFTKSSWGPHYQRLLIGLGNRTGC